MSVGRSTLGAERGAFDHLRHADLHPAGLRAARCRLVDRAQGDLAGIMYVVVYFESRSVASSPALGLQSPFLTAGFSPAKR